jgi:transposase
VVNAILYVVGHGCKWRGLPKRFGNWHAIYTRMNRWTKAGVLDRMFEELQRPQVVRIKVYPDGTGALKKQPTSYRQVLRRMYPRDWKSTTIEVFIRAVNEYILWYNEKRIKMSLGSLSPIEYRESLGLIN